MNPEDRVLVGVISRKKDLLNTLQHQWYRIPFGKVPKGIYAEWLAFFLSGKVFKEKSGGIHYFAERTGTELTQRKILLPDEPHHPHANDYYHQIQLGEIQEKIPAIWNKPKIHRFAFIYTTADRFLAAKEIRDLYSEADYFVDRVFHVLKQQGYKPIRTWEVSSDFTYPLPTATLRVMCENGEITAAPHPIEGISQEMVYLRPSQYLADAKKEARRIVEEIEKRGGARMLDIPIEF